MSSTARRLITTMTASSLAFLGTLSCSPAPTQDDTPDEHLLFETGEYRTNYISQEAINEDTTDTATSQFSRSWALFNNLITPGEIIPEFGRGGFTYGPTLSTEDYEIAYRPFTGPTLRKYDSSIVAGAEIVGQSFSDHSNIKFQILQYDSSAIPKKIIQTYRDKFITKDDKGLEIEISPTYNEGDSTLKVYLARDRSIPPDSIAFEDWNITPNEQGEPANRFWRRYYFQAIDNYLLVADGPFATMTPQAPLEDIERSYATAINFGKQQADSLAKLVHDEDSSWNTIDPESLIRLVVPYPLEAEDKDWLTVTDPAHAAYFFEDSESFLKAAEYAQVEKIAISQSIVMKTADESGPGDFLSTIEESLLREGWLPYEDDFRLPDTQCFQLPLEVSPKYRCYQTFENYIAFSEIAEEKDAENAEVDPNAAPPAPTTPAIVRIKELMAAQYSIFLDMRENPSGSQSPVNKPLCLVGNSRCDEQNDTSTQLEIPVNPIADSAHWSFTKKKIDSSQPVEGILSEKSLVDQLRDDINTQDIGQSLSDANDRISHSIEKGEY